MRIASIIGPRRDWTTALIFAALMLAAAGPCLAGGQSFSLPAPGNVTALGASPISGLKLTLDTNWSEGYGYRPIRFTVTNPTPVAAPLRIALRFSARSYNSTQQTITVEQEYELAANAASADFVLDVPQYAAWNFIYWDVWVNGRLDKHLSLREDSFTGHAVVNQALWNVLYLGPADEGYHETAPPQGPSATMRFQGGGGQGPGLVESITGPIPATWRRLSCFDAVVIGFDDLAALSGSPEEAALRRWVRSGGQLIVEQSRGDDSRLSAVAAVVRGAQANNMAAWSSMELPSAINLAVDTYHDQESILQQLRSAPKEAAVDDVKLLESGFGAVLALPASFEPPIWPSRSRQNPAVQISPSAAFLMQRTWVRRHGFSPSQSVEEFSDWLIPGVGAAPITLFRVLLTLFVLVIGPLNYWLLSVYGRLHLLVITVPALAALFTVGLLTYAVVADGLGARVRVRSLTVLDQGRGEATTWARLSYYAGLSPRGGLVFPEATACYPIGAGWNDAMFGRSAVEEREVDASPGVQRLSRGWLPARTPTQMLAITSGQAEQQIRFQRAPQGLRAANGLGFDLQLLVARDPAGEYWMAENCADGETATLEAKSRSFAVGAIREHTGRQAPEPPPGLDDRTFGDSPAGPSARIYGGRRRSAVRMEPRLNTNRMNALISALRGADGSDKEIPPGSFVAVSATSRLVPMGLEGADEQASMHVTLGDW